MRLLLLCMVAFLLGCDNSAQQKITYPIPGAYQIQEYLPSLEGKKVGLTVNHSSLIEETHLTDTLLRLGVDIAKVYAPEHGFKGTASDGVEIQYEKDQGDFELISIYGKSKKPSSSQLEGIDIMLFDMQDVGTRFFTYISSMHYVMEACAENNIPVIILDRPNPNGSYVDGPVLDTAFQSFVGMHQIPIVHGMTIGELALMIHGEGWLENRIKVELSVIPIKNWDHQTSYALPVKPSPNLPDDLSISLYPSLCLFEGTIMSVGRGTDYAFQHIGHPDYPDTTYSFTPVSREGAKWPPLEDIKCYGKSWKNTTPQYRFSLQPLIEAYSIMNRDDFFNDYFKRLAGNDVLEQQIKQGMSETEIRVTWQDDLDQFKLKRNKYLLYDE
ncbi:MAG: exo-beta-N-acetylmuramidase NamZ domain-containing protein [Ekhidna sp.]